MFVTYSTSFLFLLAAAFGVLAVANLVRLNRIYRKPYIRFVMIKLCADLVLLAWHVVMYINGTMFSKISSWTAGNFLLLVNYLVGMGVYYTSTLFLLRFFTALASVRTRPLQFVYTAITAGSASFVTTLYFMKVHLQHSLSADFVMLLFVSLSHCLVLLPALACSFGRVKNAGRRAERALRLAGLLFTATSFMALLLIIVGQLDMLKINLYFSVYLSVFVVANACIALGAGKFVDMLEGRVAAPKDTPDLSPWTLEKYGITEREAEIVNLIYRGKSNQDIADELFISLQTVKGHIYKIYRKTGVRSRVQLVRTLFGD